MMILGIHGKSPTLQEIYTHNAVAWLGTEVTVIRYEDLMSNLGDLESGRSRIFFEAIFDKAGLGQLPKDWIERVRLGADRKQSGTARENLAGLTESVPEVLPDKQKQMVDYAAPGLRALLGYL